MKAPVKNRDLHGNVPDSSPIVLILIDVINAFEFEGAEPIFSNSLELFTANDAYMRDFHLCVPSDCVASESDEVNRYALEQISTVLKADTRPSTEIDFEALESKQNQTNC